MRKVALATAAIALVVVPVSACSSNSASSDASSSASVASSAIPSANVSLPADWPADAPVPAGFQLVNVTSRTTAGKPSQTAVYQGVGNAGEVNAGLVQQLQSAGYTQTSNINGEATITNWQKGSTQIGVNVSPGSDGNITVTINVSTV